ncbi:hypothetical protein GYH30_046089 [Glycine max]|uniref:Uncharacterized protein n=1 Tax=Glycine max TaxID=3847 RepID=K7MJP6_SOYBN|nr:hypothetical protein GYH30_046089 [Glycine max]
MIYLPKSNTDPINHTNKTRTQIKNSTQSRIKEKNPSPYTRVPATATYTTFHQLYVF